MPLPSLSRWRTTIRPLPGSENGLGTLSLAGTIASSRGSSPEKPRIFGQWALVYLVAGEGTYSDSRGIKKNVAAGDWILVFPEIAHRYGPPSGGLWHEIYVCFHGPVFECWRETGHFDPRQPTGHWLSPKDGVARLGNFFDGAEQSDCTGLEAVCLWQGVLAEIFRSESHPDFTNTPWLQRALDLLEQPSSASELRLEEIAAACGLGYESFRKQFALATGRPPARYALERRIERARQLLQISRMTNKELASLLGFSDEFHFSKTFTQLTGMSPRDFRRRDRQ